MSENMKKEAIEFDGEIKTSSSGSPILGRLSGPCADITTETRNGRKYSEKLWEKVFNDPIVKEYFDCGGIFGELGHPLDGRTEIDMEKICVCMPSAPKKDKNGLLIGEWDVLNTPNGRILKCLCDYGYKIGISSRGTGDIVTDYDGTEAVDPDTYEFTAFDVVLLPAVKAARLDYVTESMSGEKTLKMALTEALNQSTEEERKVMTETLNELNINVNQSLEGVDINADENTDTADNVGVEVVKSLQETLKKNNELEKEIVELQEKLSVCYAKEANQEDTINAQKDLNKQIEKLTSVNESFKTRISFLVEKVSSMEKQLEQKSKIVEKITDEQNSLSKKNAQNVKSLNESIKSKDAQVASLKEKIQSLNENINSIKKQSEQSQQSLQENIADLKKDLSIKSKEYSQKLTKANQLVEKYKTIAQKAIDKYIDMQAVRLGVSSQAITEKLSNNYTFDDIDEVCESLQSYQVAKTRLPFDIKSQNPIRVKVKESKESKPFASNALCDDTVDDSLIALANIE